MINIVKFFYLTNYKRKEKKEMNKSRETNFILNKYIEKKLSEWGVYKSDCDNDYYSKQGPSFGNDEIVYQTHEYLTTAKNKRQLINKIANILIKQEINYYNDSFVNEKNKDSKASLINYKLNIYDGSLILELSNNDIIRLLDL